MYSMVYSEVTKFILRGNVTAIYVGWLRNSISKISPIINHSFREISTIFRWNCLENHEKCTLFGRWLAWSCDGSPRCPPWSAFWRSSPSLAWSHKVGKSALRSWEPVVWKPYDIHWDAERLTVHIKLYSIPCRILCISYTYKYNLKHTEFFIVGAIQQNISQENKTFKYYANYKETYKVNNFEKSKRVKFSQRLYTVGHFFGGFRCIWHIAISIAIAKLYVT